MDRKHLPEHSHTAILKKSGDASIAHRLDAGGVEMYSHVLGAEPVFVILRVPAGHGELVLQHSAEPVCPLVLVPDGQIVHDVLPDEGAYLSTSHS